MTEIIKYRRWIAILIVLTPCILSQDTPHGFLKPFSVDSFVYSTIPDRTSYQFQSFESKPSNLHTESFSTPGGVAETRNPDGLECPVCNVGHPNRTRYSSPPFGAKATYTFWHNHIELFASFGGIEAWKQDGLLQSIGNPPPAT